MIQPRPTEKLAFKPAELAESIGTSKSTIYALISEGRIKTKRLRRRLIITRNAAEEFIKSLPDNMEVEK